jgi:hypothetical protein
MRHFFRSIVHVAAFSAWAGAVGFGGMQLWRYESTPGQAAEAPQRWPSDTRLQRAAGLPTLVLLIHPHCSCSRATMDELSKLMTDCQGKLTTDVVMIDPSGMSDAWVHSDLWSSAAAIPGVAVMADRDGVESHRFGAATSGQALLYAADGRLLFSGGITESRGHSGDNAGRSAITTLVLENAPERAAPVHTAVYGCALFDGAPACCRDPGSTK